MVFLQAADGTYGRNHSSEEIRKQYREYVKRQSKAEEKLERGIDMLLEVAELKYGRQYAQSLKKKMRGGTD